MRYGIFADVHSNLEALTAVLEALRQEPIDKYLCAGDIVGYASNPSECIEKIKSLNSVVIAGNHDWAVVNLFALDFFNPVASEAVLWTRRRLDEKNKLFLESLKLTYQDENLTLVHATLDNPAQFNYMTDGFIAEESFRLLRTPICFLGHTHISGIFTKEKKEHINYREDDFVELVSGNQYIVNVGSVGQPRDGNPKATYCIYDTDKKYVEIKRVAYDAEAARKKIVAIDLPRYLGDRLLLGR